MKISTHDSCHRRGATVVESAFVLSLTFIFCFAIYDYGRYFMLSQMVNNACREGARQAVATTNTQNTVAIQNTVMQYLGSMGLTNTSGLALKAADVQVYQVTAVGWGFGHHVLGQEVPSASTDRIDVYRDGVESSYQARGISSRQKGLYVAKLMYIFCAS